MPALVEIGNDVFQHRILLGDAIGHPVRLVRHRCVGGIRQSGNRALRRAHGKAFQKHRLAHGRAEGILHGHKLQLNRMGQLMRQRDLQIDVLHRHQDRRRLAVHRRNGESIVVELADIEDQPRVDLVVGGAENFVVAREHLARGRFSRLLKPIQLRHQCGVFAPRAVQQLARHRIAIGTGRHGGQAVLGLPQLESRIGIERLGCGVGVECLEFADTIVDVENMIGGKGGRREQQQSARAKRQAKGHGPLRNPVRTDR